MKFFLIVPALAIAGCASYSGIVPAGDGTYMVSKQQATGFPGLGNMKAELLTEADTYCRKDGRAMSIVRVNETQPPYVLGNYPRSEVTFACK